MKRTPSRDPEKRRQYWQKWGPDYLLKNRKRIADYLDHRRRTAPEVHYQQTAEASQRYRQRMLQVKIRLAELLGGRCPCGVDDIRVLDFDHKDPRTKRFSLNTNNLHRPWEELVEEAMKCQLLCANCHRIKTIENGECANHRGQRKFRHRHASNIPNLVDL